MTAYPLSGVVRYFRKPTACGLLHSMARHVAASEKRGETLEFALMYFDRAGTYVGVSFVAPGEPALEAKNDDDS